MRLLPLRRLFVVRLVMSPLVPASVIDVFRAAAKTKAARAQLLMVGGARRTRTRTNGSAMSQSSQKWGQKKEEALTG